LLSYRMKKKWAAQFKVWVQLFRWWWWLRLDFVFFCFVLFSFFLLFSFFFLYLYTLYNCNLFYILIKITVGTFPHCLIFKKKKIQLRRAYTLSWHTLSSYCERWIFFGRRRCSYRADVCNTSSTIKLNDSVFWVYVTSRKRGFHTPH
jgi:hypothetical protein